MNPEQRPITVEDLLRLKRAEKPAAEFWSQFDRELRAKQLAALVAKRPWWQRLPRLAARLAPYRLPLGAAAALAVTFVSVRNYSDEPLSPASSVSVSHGTIADVVAPLATSASVTVHHASSVGPGAAVAVESQLSVAPFAAAAHANLEHVVSTSAGSQLDQDATATLELSRIVPLFGATEIPDPTEMSPSARSIAVNNRRAAELTDAFGGGLLTVSAVASSHGFESRGLPARAAVVDPLQQMTPPGEARRARYQTAMVSTVSEESLDRTTARMAHRISGDELYEQVQRFGTRRGGFNVKF